MTGQFIVFLLAVSATPVLAAEPVAGSEEAAIVVIGNRGAARILSDSPAPVDVYTADDLTARGLTDISRALQFITPSFNYARSATAPSAANTRAATLRGLSPDEVLVLVNGKRWHASSVINFNNVIGRGSVPVDLNTIPLSAVARIEVLRDGAAAQYGSDAIAGVINIVLQTSGEGGSLSGQSGLASAGDGALYIGALNKGFRLGTGGSVNVTAELRSRAPTNRVAIDSRYGRITGEQGDPDSLDVNTSLNAVYDFGGTEFYGDLLYAHRRSVSPAQFRAPGVSVLYPNGFVPHIRLSLDDAGGTIGLRGKVGAWSWDVSDTPGYNNAQFRVGTTANGTLGAASPTDFDAGGSDYFQNVANLTVSRSFNLLAGASLSVGAEHRYEHYTIRSGEAASFAGAGAQGFPGFNPPSPVRLSRNAVSAFADGEIRPIPMLTLGGAVRYEHYSDFGDTVSGKVNALLKPASFVALRANAATGFRAPALQQIGFSTVTSQSSGGVLVNVGTFAVDDPVARALGASPLRRERSRSFGGGVVLTPASGLTLSADYFQIVIKDRIALSETLSGAAVTAVLKAAGITNASQARFFTNALDTTTDGVEAAATWKTRLGRMANLSLNLAYARATTTIDRLAANPVLPALALLGASSKDLLTTAQPEDKIVAAARLEAGGIGFTADVTRFGQFKAISLVQEQVFGAVTTVDLTADFTVGSRFRFGVGVLNAGDAYPDKIVDRAISQGGSLQYPEVGGLGTNGREYFARATVLF